MTGLQGRSRGIELSLCRSAQLNPAATTVGRVRCAMDQITSFHTGKQFRHGRLLYFHQRRQVFLIQSRTLFQGMQDRDLRRSESKPFQQTLGAT